MAYRTNPNEKVPISSFTLGDWIAASFALALGATTFFSVFHMFAWAVGWPGPYLWFGTQDRLGDILSSTVAIGLATFFMNVFGSFVILGFFAIRAKLRSG